ncbi:MAG: ABC transporter ATP-binding protein [Corynebacterium sp.]|nr:ABC transporter ATP-binding protein [Corynebacterium sp.]
MNTSPTHSTPDMPTLAAQGITKTIGPKTLWSHLDLEVFPGEILCLMGPSGCGKSTLLNCLGQLDTCDSGKIFIQGERVENCSARKRRLLRRTTIGYLFQDFALIENQTVRENIALALPRRTKRSERTHLIQETLMQVGLEGFENTKIYALSGGEQQRVAMARLWARQPPVILADEPTASLDRENATRILTLLRKCADTGAAVVLVSHDPWVADHADRKVQLAS